MPMLKAQDVSNTGDTTCREVSPRNNIPKTTSLRLAILQAAQERIPLQEQPTSYIRLSTAYRRRRLELNHGRAEMKLLLKCPSRRKK